MWFGLHVLAFWTTPVYPSELRASLKSLCHTRSGVTRVLGARGQKQWSAPPIFSGGRTGPECKMLCSRVPKQVGNQTSKLGCDRPLLAHSANFIVPTFVFVSHEIFSAKAVLRPLACCARGQLPPPRQLRQCIGLYVSAVQIHKGTGSSALLEDAYFNRSYVWIW